MKKKVESIRTFPDSILKIKTKDVEQITGSIIKTFEDMINIVRLADGAGLAANQIGIAKSLVIALLDDKKFIKLINPVIKQMEGEQTDEEGCLSIPEATVKVHRAKELIVEYLDIEGNKKILEVDGFTARVLQHEIDHINGVLIIDYLKPDEKLKFVREYKK